MEVLVYSAGRINIIGEHVDYVNGLSIPASINLGNYINISKYENIQVRGIFIYSKLYNKELFISYDEIYDFNKDDLKKIWYGYIIAPFLLLKDKGVIINEPIKIIIDTTLPLSAGLSSSASILCGMIYSLTKYFNLPFNRFDVALLAKETENKYIGAPCGFLDQLSICYGEKDKLLFLDYEKINKILSDKRKTNFVCYLNLKGNYEFFIINSNVKHSISGEGYTTRIKEKDIIQEALKKYNLNVRSFAEIYLKYFNGFEKIKKINEIILCNLDKYFASIYDNKDNNNIKSKYEFIKEKFIDDIIEYFYSNKDLNKSFFIFKWNKIVLNIIDEIKNNKNYDYNIILKRLFHFVTEIGRTKLFKYFVKRKEYEEAFKLLWVTHISLALFYEVSVEEIEYIMMELYKNRYFIKGARLMGGGFGGSIIFVCEKGNENLVENTIYNKNEKYKRLFNKEISFNKVIIKKGLE
ncbi:MAG: hypothetical protein N3A58_02075 [Spirochaetes bacterium]|nr:hypothetical protein [Spirochaetota bacterium]